MGLALNLQELADADADPGAASLHNATVELFTTLGHPYLTAPLKDTRPDVYALIEKRADAGWPSGTGDAGEYAASVDAACRSRLV